MPERASSIMTSSTSLIISGSSADVGSSNSMMCGFMQSARAMATRCCWPPESWPGYFSACSGILTRVEVLHREPLGLGARHLLHPDRGQAQVVQDGQMREQVERLEHHADLGADAVDLAQIAR